jgi:hypothetical protein
MNQKDKNFVISARQEYRGIDKALTHYRSHLLYLEAMQEQFKGFTAQIKTCKKNINLLEIGLTAGKLSIV